MSDEKILQDILDIVSYIKDNSVNSVEFSDFKKEVREEFKLTKGYIISHVDHFIGLHTKLDTELTALRAK